jgi:preprotein translocase subunit YajC
MSLSSLLGLPTAHAAPAAAAAGQHPGAASMFSPLILMVLFIVVMYFLLIRPQSRKRKEHQKLITELGVGDDVVTIGGIIGRISKLKDDFIVVMVSKDTELTMQKSSVANVLPKGTFEE